MNGGLRIALFTLFVSLSGCARDYSLSPPPDSEQITVTVKVPEELKARTFQVMYRSTLCTFTDHTAGGRPYPRDGYQSTDIQPVRQGQSDLYQASLPKDGGGACQWRLSNVTFGVAYKDPARFGEDATFGGGGGIIAIFDHNNSPRGGADFEVAGDLILKKDYYPWISENFLGGYQKFISLTGEGKTHVKYQVLQARRVYFEPVLHSEFVLHSVGPKVKKDGHYTAYTYPDGSVVDDRTHMPNFRKLQAIRHAAEGKQ
ncbi:MULTISPECIES: hypothetical protein [Pseudomonas]|uniref:hypothetical protein n=1 Tax=Pseudomonas TaxID=286 RepID=UPI001BEABD8D|nr:MULTISPECIES: hypothetical protein [Pseudomonas]MBT2339756.1 hypothetical protein [Pseudomonas fluorescens]MCD4528542.1 hypothetical protein [Pseudomonas sp. C3-2018]